MTDNTDSMTIIQSIKNSSSLYVDVSPLTMVQILVQFALMKTIQLSNTGILSISGAIILSWADQRLAWNCSNALTISIPAKYIWNPNIRLGNCPDNNPLITPDRDGIAYVFCDGYVSLIVQRQFTSTCRMNLNSFPFDSQTCNMTFLALTLGPFGAGLAFSNPPNLKTVELSYYEETGEFSLSNASILAPAPDVCQFGRCVPSFSMSFSYTRQSSYYVLNMITPAILLTMVIAFAFIIPSENSIKVTMTCSLMVSLYVLQQNVSRVLPPGASSSLCALGTLASLILGCFAAVGTICNVILRMQKPNISCLTACLRKLAWLRCASRSTSSGLGVVSHNANAVGIVRELPTAEVSLSSFSADECKSLTRVEELMARLVAVSEEQLSRNKKESENQAVAKVAENNWRTLDAITNCFMFLVYAVAAVVCVLTLELQI